MTRSLKSYSTPADPRVAGVEAVARHLLVDVVDLLAEVEREEEGRERPEVERRGPGAEQVVADPRQLADDHADVLAARWSARCPSSFSTAWCQATSFIGGLM